MAEIKTIEITHNNKTNNKKSQREKNKEQIPKEHPINEKNKEQIPKEQIPKEIPKETPKEIPKKTKHRQNVNRQSVIENVLDRDRLYSIALPPTIKSTNK